jgi:hypothetical protein
MTISAAMSLIEAAKAEGVTLSLAAGDGVTIAGPGAVKDRYVSAVKAAKPWVRAALRPADPSAEHQCHVCGGAARFGFGVNLRNDKDGLWACREHQAEVEASDSHDSSV